MSASGSETAQGATAAPAAGKPGAGEAPRVGRAGGPGRRLWAAGLAAAAVLLFAVYLPLTNTYPEDSDQANLCTPQQAAAGVRYTFDSPQAPSSAPVLLHFGHTDVVAGPVNRS